MALFKCCLIFSIVFAFSHKATATDTFQYEDCSNGNGIATISKLSLLPDPLSLSNDLTATADITFHEDVPEGALVKINLYKVKYVFGYPVSIPIPCIGGYGSCTTEHCQYISPALAQVCPFFPKGEKCTGCPIKANRYAADSVTVPLPEFGPLVKFIASGHYKFQLRLITKDAEKELLCLIVTGKITP